MTDAMDALYLYAQEHLFHMLLAQESNYYVRLHREDQYEQRLRAALDEAGQKILDDLIRTKVDLALSGERAAFQAGIRVALELSAR